ncbi:MAG: hypothetical protein RR383_05380 [Muribaculaceae bacterium]
MTLNIISAAKIEFTGNVESITLPGEKGLFTVLENHASIISLLTHGVIEYIQGGKHETMDIQGGIVDVDSNIVSVCLY